MISFLYNKHNVFILTLTLRLEAFGRLECFVNYSTLSRIFHLKGRQINKEYKKCNNLNVFPISIYVLIKFM